LKGRLLNLTVEIDERAIEIGGSWEGPIVGGLHSAWGEEELQLFYRKLRGMHSPTFLDIGANTGSFCLLTKFVPGAKCIAFEPHPPSFEVLQHHIQLNGLEDRVLPVKCALFNKNGKAKLKVPASGRKSGMSCLGKPLRFKQWTTVWVKTGRLDDIINKLLLQLERTVVDLVKIDTEGAELMILRGGKNVFSKWQPPILLEFYEPNCQQFNYHPGEIIDLLVKYGYNEFKKVGVDDLWVEAAK
jgi:FkbM family methyltransferase